MEVVFHPTSQFLLLGYILSNKSIFISGALSYPTSQSLLLKLYIIRQVNLYNLDYTSHFYRVYIPSDKSIFFSEVLTHQSSQSLLLMLYIVVSHRTSQFLLLGLYIAEQVNFYYWAYITFDKSICIEEGIFHPTSQSLL